jgi:hypothetical protein
MKFKTWYAACLLLAFNIILSIAGALGLISGGLAAGEGALQLIAGGIADSTVNLPFLLSTYGVPKTIAATIAFGTWFVYAVGLFQLVTVRFLSGSD